MCIQQLLLLIAGTIFLIIGFILIIKKWDDKSNGSIKLLGIEAQGPSKIIILLLGAALFVTGTTTNCGKDVSNPSKIDTATRFSNKAPVEELRADDFELECYNGPDSTHPTGPFQSAHMEETGFGVATSFKVQFNINTEAVAGTIFVNKNNSGNAIATVHGNYILTEGWAVIDPHGSSTIDDRDKTHRIDDCIKIRHSNIAKNQIRFIVEGIGSLRGNITITFFVRYKKNPAIV